MSVAERILPESDIGKEVFYEAVKNALSEKIDELNKLDLSELTEKRYLRFRKLGTEHLSGE